jgi:ABC-type molybdate transport system ATPase subunit
VFDDPFVTLDDVRATRALALLKRVASDFQIVYLTTSDRYDGAADSVVELPGPTAIDDSVEDPALATPGSAAIEGAA